jgi:hypothetical protein
MRELSDAAIKEFLAHAADLAAHGAPLIQLIIFRIGRAPAGARQPQLAVRGQSGLAAAPDLCPSWQG